MDKETLRHTIARLLHDQMGIDPDRCLADVPFHDLHKDFDSLAFLELQLLLEKELSMEFDGHPAGAELPKNVSQLADAVIREYGEFQKRQEQKAAKQKAKTASANAR